MSIVLYTVSYTLVVIFADSIENNQSRLIHFIIDATILIIAVLRMRKVVLNFRVINPNKKLVLAHLILFGIMIISFFVTIVFEYLGTVASKRRDGLSESSPEFPQAKLEEEKALSKFLICMIESYAIFIFLQLFLLYMLLRFAKPKVPDMIDPITGRQVPAMVFLQNRILLQEFINDKLELDEETRIHLKVRAEATEYLYSLFKQEGISAEISTDIGIDFINFDATRKESGSTFYRKEIASRMSHMATDINNDEDE